MKIDVQIAKEAKMLPITDLTEKLGVNEEYVEQYGKYKAKISLDYLNNNEKEDGKLILVSAISPTPAGEGKTTTNVGLSMALNKLGYNAITAIREPSLGPCFGIKGGAAGGGYAQVVPMEDINLHFTGDIHAIGAANNLLAAMIDNHIFAGNALNIDPRRVTWKRAIDMNDRALRNIVVGLGLVTDGIPRQDGFNITVASEIMAVLCLADSTQDLKERLDRMVVGFTYDRQPVTCGQLNATGALALLLKDAIKPNIVQTLENTPALIHGGPFANIAHGCNSLLATKMALKMADYVVTEAGFGADLGAEKFVDIKMRQSGLKPDGAVLVATIRALKMHGGVDKKELDGENVEALENGFKNLVKQYENLRVYGIPVVVAINKFPTDTEKEIEKLSELMAHHEIRFALSEVFAKGGEGGIEMAKAIIEEMEAKENNFQLLYDVEASIPEKIETIAKKIYGAESVAFTAEAKRMMRQIEDMGQANLPICMAKTQYSLSDDPTLLGRPEGFEITIRELRLSAGAGFIVAITGAIMTMPGLPKVPAAEKIDVDETGKITGLF